MIDHAAVMLALRNQLLTVAEIPPKPYRAWENLDFVPAVGTPYLEEDYVPAGGKQRSFATNGLIEILGLYVVRYFGIGNTPVGPIWTVVNAILNAFPPNFAPSLLSGDALRVRADQTPYAGQILPTDSGHACVTITIPWRLLTPKSS